MLACSRDNFLTSQFWPFGALFNLDCDLVKAMEDALMEHGGAAGTELQTANGEVAGEAA